MQSDTVYFVGVDGGGTKCRAEVFSAGGESLGAAVAGPANVARLGDIARQSMINAVSAALASAGLTAMDQLKRTAVGAGLAGANIPSAAQALQQWQHPFASFAFTSDLHAAMLGAHGGKNGAVLVVGTGSCAAALYNGKLHQYGGHGFALGDKGSGAWMGRQAVICTLESLDGVVADNKLAQAVCDHYQCVSTVELVDKLNHAPPAQFGELAPLILKLAGESEPMASEIVQAGTDYLTSIARRALSICDGKLVLVGGVADAIIPWLATDVRDAIVNAQHGPEWGAFYFQQQAKQE